MVIAQPQLNFERVEEDSFSIEEPEVGYYGSRNADGGGIEPVS